MASQNYSYNTSNPYDVPQVDPRDYYAQAEQKAACQNYLNQTNADLNGGYWKSALSDAAQQGQGSLSGIGSTLIGKPIPTKSLQDELNNIENRLASVHLQAERILETLFGSKVGQIGAEASGCQQPTFSQQLSNVYRVLTDIDAILGRVNNKIGGR